MKYSASKLARRALICATYLAFGCRLLIPGGYMPAAWGDGGPISLCPMGLPTGLLPERPGHHHDHDDDSRGADLLWEYCPFGTLTDSAPMVPEIQFQPGVFRHVRPRGVEPGQPFSSSPLGFHSRAPPRFVA